MRLSEGSEEKREGRKKDLQKGGTYHEANWIVCVCDRRNGPEDNLIEKETARNKGQNLPNLGLQLVNKIPGLCVFYTGYLENIILFTL